MYKTSTLHFHIIPISKSTQAHSFYAFRPTIDEDAGIGGCLECGERPFVVDPPGFTCTDLPLPLPLRYPPDDPDEFEFDDTDEVCTDTTDELELVVLAKDAKEVLDIDI